MTLREFIETRYPIEQRVKAIKSNPIQQVMDNDDLPYDCITVIDGQYQKAVEIENGRFMSVIELLSYDKADIEASEDKDLKIAYNAYFDNITQSVLELDYVAGAVEAFKANREAKKELLTNVQNSAS